MGALPRTRTTGNQFVLVLLMFFLCTIAESVIALEYPEGTDPLPFTLSYLEDPSGSLSVQEVLAQKSQFLVSETNAPNFGFTESAYWFSINTSDQLAEEQLWLLEVGYPMLDQVNLYSRDNNGNYTVTEGGDKHPFSVRKNATRNTSFEVATSPGSENNFLLRVQTASSLQVPIKFWSMSSFASSMQTQYLLLGVYYGIMLALLAYNLMLIVWIRDPVYLYYAGYLATFSLFQLSITGLGFKYIWPESVFMAEHALPLFMSLSAFFSTIFSHSLLQVRKYMPAHHPVLVALASVFLLATLATFLFDYRWVIKSLTALVLVGSVYLIYVATQSLKSGVTTARYYLAASLSFLVCVAIYALKAQGSLPTNIFTEHAIQVGSALGAILLSFALAHRFKIIKDQVAVIQTHAKETLEQRVEERTRELKIVLEELTVSNARLEGLNNTDQLTGINNRTFFDSHIEYVWSNTARANEYLTILMVDVDHFKDINDTYGHLVGDEVLVAIAQTIKKTLTRSTDQVARYGGEEFVVALPSTHESGALIVAERIRKSVEMIRTIEFGLGSEVTVSIGISCVSPATSNLRIRDVMAQADKALYHAKHNGRNRSETFTGDSSTVVDFSTAFSSGKP